jgi:hypothetical protein
VQKKYLLITFVFACFALVAEDDVVIKRDQLDPASDLSINRQAITFAPETPVFEEVICYEIVKEQECEDCQDPCVYDGGRCQKKMPDKLEYALNCFVNGLNIPNLKFVDKNAYGDCGIEKVDLLFDLYDDVAIPRARELILQIVNALLGEINLNEKLKCYFKSLPLKVDQLVIRIRVEPTRCGFTYPQMGNIAYISAIDGLITYSTRNSFTYELDNLHLESYSQAMHIYHR